MRRRTDATLITAAVRQLDPAGAAELTEAERERAETAFARIVATPRDEPVPVEPDRPHRRRGRILVALGLAGATAVATPVLLGGGSAYGTWSPTPTTLTGTAAEGAAETCGKGDQAAPPGAPASVPAVGSGGRLVMAERRGGWTFVMIQGPGRQQGVCLMRNDDIGKEAPAESIGGYYDTDAAEPPTVAPDRIAVNVSAEGSTDEGWFNWLEGYVGSDVTGVSVHTSSGLEIRASVVGNRFAAWWPGRVQSSDHPGGETWRYTVHLADGNGRNTKCSVQLMEVC